MIEGMRVVRVIPAVAVALAVTIAAMGQDKPTSQEVRISASKVVTVRNGHPRRGIRNETVQLTERVSYADLNLASSSGETMLEQRIRDTADAICAQLGVLFPTGSMRAEKMDRAACVKGAVDGAMAQARLATASAGEPTRR